MNDGIFISFRSRLAYTITSKSFIFGFDLPIIKLSPKFLKLVFSFDMVNLKF